MSWIISTPSKATPTATVMFAHPTNLERWSARACNTSLIGSGVKENMSDWFDRRLRFVAIGALIFYAFCIWEFSIGIKRSINKLFTVHLMLDISRYIAYIVPIRHGNESVKHSETRPDHSGTGRGQLD
jgi:hypothetical protein